MFIFTLIMGVFLFGKVRAGIPYDFNKQSRDIYQAVFDLKFAKAQQLIALEKSSHPENNVPVSLENTKNCISLFISEDPSLYRFYKNTRSEIRKKLESSSDQTPLRRYLLARYYLDWAFAEIKFRDFFHAATDLKQAHDLLIENQQIYPNFLINNIGLGIIHFVMSIIPDQYQWIISLIGMHASPGQSIMELESVAYYQGSDELIRMHHAETVFYLTFVKMNLQMSTMDITDVEKLMEKIMADGLTSPLMIYAGASLLMKNGKNDQALEVLQHRSALIGTFPFYYLDYLEGVSQLNKLDDQAAGNFIIFLNNFKGTNYRVSAMNRMAWISALKNDPEQFRNWSSKILQFKQLWTDEDKQAVSDAEKGVMPNVRLLKARLLFDGGYYQKSIDELSKIPVSNLSQGSADRVEYHYRFGRIYQMTGEKLLSIRNFNIAIDLRGKSDTWYPAASAFQLGNIYENMKEYDQAAKCYHLCLSENNREYRNSLRQKAKAGLNRIEGKTKTESLQSY